MNRIIEFLEPLFLFYEDKIEPHFNWDYDEGYDLLAAFVISSCCSYILHICLGIGIAPSLAINVLILVFLKFLVGWIRHIILDIDISDLYLDKYDERS